MAGRAANMSIDDLQQVAQVLKSNGTDGELVLGFRDIAPEDINLEEPVFIVFDGLPVPFFIESFTKRGNTKALVHLTDICSMEDVEEIEGKAVYVAEDSMPEMSLEEDGYAALVGWMVLTPGDFSTSLEMTGDEFEMTGDEFEMTEEELETTEEEFEMTEEEFEMTEDELETTEDEFETTEDELEMTESDTEETTDCHSDRPEGVEESVVLMEVGEITDFMDIPNNPCIEVETENGAVILPLHEDFIISIDPENQEIIMQIPAGLI